MRTVTLYAPTFLDMSMTRPDKRGNQRPTGDLSGMVFARTFSTMRGCRIRASRNVISFSWNEDTADAKAVALAKVIEGMDEHSGLDSNPPLNWIPQTVKEKLS